MPTSSKSSPTKPPFVTAKQVIGFNKSFVADRGEPYVLLSKDRLLSAIVRPINLYEYTGTTDVCQLAASLIFGLAKAHAFAQGNKRTAFASGLRFIDQCGFGYHGGRDGMDLGLLIIDLCNNNATEDEIVRFLSQRFVYLMERGRTRNR